MDLAADYAPERVTSVDERNATGHVGDLGILATVTAEFEQLCHSLDESRWGLPTPCTEWDLGQLVDHVTGGNWFTADILMGIPGEEALASARERLAGGRQRRETAIRSVRDQHEAFVLPGALERPCQHVGGELSGAEVLRIRLHELIVHTWDVAETVRPPGTIPGHHARWALAELASPDSLTSLHFGLDLSALDDRSEGPQTRLLAAFGRAG